MSADGTVFRPAFLRPFIFIALGGLLGGALIVWTRGLELYPEAAIAALIGDVAIAGLSSIAFMVFLTVRVGDQGIHGYDFWCFYHHVRWQDIKSVTPINLFGLRYLRLERANARARVWLPLFLSNMHEFEVQVFRHAGADHRLSRYFLDVGA